MSAAAKTRRTGALAPLMALALAACGGGATTPTPIPTPTPTPVPPPQVVSQGSGALEADMIGRVPFTTTLAGRLDVNVNWTFDADDLDVFVTKGTCTFDQFFADACEHAGFAASTTAKPEHVSFAAAAGSYTLFIGNHGPKDESLSWQVVLTPGAAAASSASAAARPGSPLRGLRAGPTFRQ